MKVMNPYEKEVKELKNNISVLAKRIPGIKTPRDFSNYILEVSISRGLYGKTFNEISSELKKQALAVVKPNNIISYMNSTNYQVIIAMLNKVSNYLDSKDGISYELFKPYLYEMIEDQSSTIRKNYYKENRESLIGDLRRAISYEYAYERAMENIKPKPITKDNLYDPYERNYDDIKTR